MNSDIWVAQSAIAKHKTLVLVYQIPLTLLKLNMK